MKQVVYNGGTKSYYGCSDPAVLTIGQVYEVIQEEDRGWQTDYTLKGIAGQFNSVWFDIVEPAAADKPTYNAYGKTLPIVGRRYKIQRLNEHNKFETLNTSKVRSVEPLDNNTYKVTTRNSIYIVKVL